MPTDVAASATEPLFAILDTNVLLPPRLSDILFDLYLEGFYCPRWTKAIEEEFIRNFGRMMLAKDKTDRKNSDTSSPDPLHIAIATHRLSCFRAAVGPEYQVYLYDRPEYLSKVPSKVHRNDCHVASAALALQTFSSMLPNTNRIVIVSNNLKHLDVEGMHRLGISVVSPGEFINQLNNTDPVRVENALLRSTTDLSFPGCHRATILATLRKNGAHDTAIFYAEKWSNFLKKEKPGHQSIL